MREATMLPICFALGEAAYKSGVSSAGLESDLLNVEKPEWRAAYRRGYEKARRKVAAQAAAIRRRRAENDDAA